MGGCGCVGETGCVSAGALEFRLGGGDIFACGPGVRNDFDPGWLFGLRYERGVALSPLCYQPVLRVGKCCSRSSPR